MRAFGCLFFAIIIAYATCFKVSRFALKQNRFSLSMSDKPDLHFKTDKSEPNYTIVPLEKTEIQNAVSVSGGVVGYCIGGPVLGVILAAITNYASKKDNVVSEGLQGFGKAIIEAYNYLNKINAKYELTDKIGSTVKETFNDLTKNSESLAPVKKTFSETIAKVEELNKEYDLVGKAKEYTAIAADFTDTVIEKTIQLNEKVRT